MASCPAVEMSPFVSRAVVPIDFQSSCIHYRHTFSFTHFLRSPLSFLISQFSVSLVFIRRDHDAFPVHLVSPIDSSFEEFLLTFKLKLVLNRFPFFSGVCLSCTQGIFLSNRNLVDFLLKMKRASISKLVRQCSNYFTARRFILSSKRVPRVSTQHFQMKEESNKSSIQPVNK